MSAPAWRRYLTFWRTPVARDVDDELRFHASMRLQEYVARGMSEDDARRGVAERLGDMAAARAECVTLGEIREREAHSLEFIIRFLADLRIAMRSLARSPAVAVTATVILAVGIGMAIAMSTVVRA